MAAGSMNSALTSGLRKAKQLAREERRQAVRQTVRSTAAAYSSAPEKRRQEAGPITAAKQENTPARTQSGGHKEAYLSLPTGQKAAYARELLSHYRSGKERSGDLEKQPGKTKAVSGRGSTLHISASGSKHGGSHGSFGEVSVYEQRRQQRDEARKDFWNHTLDLLGTASAQAGRGITGTSVPVEQQREESRRQIENVRAIREANARFEAARKPIEWDGRAELISALERLDMQSGWEINEEQANAAEQQRQELLARLREGDLAAGNGVRSGTDADTGRDVVEGTAKGIAGAGVNLVSNLGQLMAKADAYTYSENEFLTDWMLGNDPNAMRQARIDAYESAEAKEYWSSIDAIADRLDNDAATVLRRAKEGKSIVGEAGVDVAKGVLEAGFDAGLAAVTGGSALVPLAARVYGQSVGTARRAGATPEQQAAYGLTSAAIEVASEMLFDGVAKIYGAGAADDIVEKLVVELAESDTGRSMLRFLAGAAGEGAEEIVSDLLSPLAEATYRDESLAELYRQLDPADLLYSFMIGAAISTLASGASAVAGQRGEASAEYRANEAEYLSLLERQGLLPPESTKNAAHEGAAKENTRNLLQHVKEKLSSHIGKTRAQVIRSMSFGEQVAGIESGLISRKEKPFANVRETTPEILVWEAGADPLPIIMSYESAFLSARSEGPQPGHYHKLGAELMSQIPEAMEHPLKIIRQKNGRIAEVLDLKDQNERKVFLSIELSAIKDVDGTHSAYNLIITAFGAGENYIERQLGKEGNTVLKK